MCIHNISRVGAVSKNVTPDNYDLIHSKNDYTLYWLFIKIFVIRKKFCENYDFQRGMDIISPIIMMLIIVKRHCVTF